MADIYLESAESTKRDTGVVKTKLTMKQTTETREESQETALCRMPAKAALQSPLSPA